MLSPRSFLLAHRQQQRQQSRPALGPSAAPSTSYASTNNNNTCTPSPSSPSSPIPLPSSSFSSHSPSPSYYSRPTLDNDTAAAITTSPTFSPVRWSPKHDEGKNDNITITVTPVPVPRRPPVSDAIMGKRKDRRETMCLSPSSPPTTTTSLTTRPTTPTSPVRIPAATGNRPVAHPQKRHTSSRMKMRDSHLSPDSISPSLVALLAVTDIPRPDKLRRRRRRTVKSMTVDEVMECHAGSEKEMGWSLSRSPLDMLLSPPSEVMDDDDSMSECNIGSGMSTRTYSVDSIPSLDESFSSDNLSAFDTPRTPSPLSRRSRFAPKRVSLEPIISPPGSVDEHPLAPSNDDDDLEFTSLKEPEENSSTKLQFLQPFKPLRSVFKSNLTASLRALRSAAKSFSAINFSSIPSDDMLTRSILTIDPNVPYADERRPPVLEEIPSEAMRRYLNPTTASRIESPTKTNRAGTFAASIQMRTYKIQRNRAALPPGRNPYPSTSLQPTPAPQQPQPQAPPQNALPPGMRQREMRENSDFIRIAVMEMAMRKRGKLDDQRPGRARWALPPRKTSNKPYEVASDGIPVRWIPITV